MWSSLSVTSHHLDLQCVKNGLMLMLNGCQQDKRLLMGFHGDHCMSCNIEMLCTEVKIFLLGSGLNTQCIQLAVDSDGTMMELCNNKKKTLSEII